MIAVYQCPDIECGIIVNTDSEKIQECPLCHSKLEVQEKVYWSGTIEGGQWVVEGKYKK
jgi:hypothetical protein